MERFTKGYQADAGTDILLDRIVVIERGMNVIDLNVQITPSEGTMSYLVARTSAAKEGLIVVGCPIDANYTGNVTALVYNAGDTIAYDEGTAFCQVVTVPIANTNVDARIKKEGKRTNGKYGSTGGVNGIR